MLDQEVSILLVDDHPMFLDAIRPALKDKIPQALITTKSCIADVHDLLTVGSPLLDLAIVDIDLPDGNGTSLIEDLRSRYGIRTIALSGHADLQMINDCAKAGASGFVSKTEEFDIFYLAVQAVLAGAEYFPALARLNDRRRSPIVSLTKRQIEVLELVLHGESNRSIADSLELTEGTVKNHVSDLHAIFHTASRNKLIVEAERYRSDRRINSRG